MAKRIVVPDFLPRPHIPCAYAGCREDAMTRRKTPTGWANLCFTHDDALHLAGVKERLAAKGLERNENETREAWIARLLAFMASCRFPIPVRQREPGDDDEEIIAAP